MAQQTGHVAVSAARQVAPLPGEVVERIAAGEVIERPASVVRELIENALDAGATSIRVEVRDGGLRLIRVADDGVGIPADELEIACLPHTTSKLRTLRDLDAIGTLGFRGEALASIAAVAELELTSATAAEGLGSRLLLRTGRPSETDVAPRARGTTVAVRSLFAEVPSRRAQLRGPAAEAARVLAVVRGYALAHPAVSFTYVSDGTLVLQTHGDGLAATFRALYGADVASSLVLFQTDVSAGIDITGAVAGRSHTMPNRDYVVVVVNGRPVTNRPLLVAAEAGYRPLLRKGRHPLLAVAITVPPDTLDPNVHPSKAEVLLRGEGGIAAALRSQVHDALGRAALPLAKTGLPHRTRSLGAPVQLPLPSPRRRSTRRLAERPISYDAVLGVQHDSTPPATVPLEPVGQFDATLILARSPEGHLYLVDQHRAHERILYERLMAQRASLHDGELAESAGQLLLQPVLVELSPLQAELLASRLDELATLGLRCQEFGGSAFLIRAVPSVSGARQSPSSFAEALLADAAIDSDQWMESICASLACRSAIRRGQILTPAEQRALLSELHTVAAPAACPHGSPVLLRYTHSSLAQAFEW